MSIKQWNIRHTHTHELEFMMADKGQFVSA